MHTYIITGFIILLILLLSNNIGATCSDGTYMTKAICFYQPENKLCPIYCEDYKLYCLKGKYIITKDSGHYVCMGIEEWIHSNLQIHI